MKSLAKTTILIAATIGFMGTAQAATQTDNQQLQQMIERIVNQRTAKLQKQVTDLQSQVVSLKTQLRTANQSVKSVNASSQSRYTRYPQTKVRTAILAQQTGKIRTETARQSINSAILNGLYLGGTPVFTSPYLGLHSAYDGSDLIVNASKVNLDVRLLKQAAALERRLQQEGYPLPQHPVIELSGKLEAQGIYTKSSGASDQGDIDLASAELDMFARMSHWVNGYMVFKYDNSPSPTRPSRVANSRLFLDQGFITVGNLNETPFYGTIGQLYVPFGQYSSYMVSTPLTELVGRIRARAAVLGFRPMSGNGPFAAIYGFKSATSADKSRNGGFNVGLEAKSADGNDAQISAGLVRNIADSEGMQSTGGAVFGGFNTSAMTEALDRVVPGFDTQGSIDYGNYSLLAEYVGATRKFTPVDLSFNGHGARPQAAHIEGVYHFNYLGKPGNFVLGYGMTREALALNLPKNRYFAVLNYSIWKNTIESLEFRHDVNYSSSDVSSGIGSPAFGPTYHINNVITGQFGVYF